MLGCRRVGGIPVRRRSFLALGRRVRGRTSPRPAPARTERTPMPNQLETPNTLHSMPCYQSPTSPDLMTCQATRLTPRIFKRQSLGPPQAIKRTKPAWVVSLFSASLLLSQYTNSSTGTNPGYESLKLRLRSRPHPVSLFTKRSHRLWVRTIRSRLPPASRSTPGCLAVSVDGTTPVHLMHTPQNFPRLRCPGVHPSI